MTSLLFPEARRCGWCHDANATTLLYGTPTCVRCAVEGSDYRVAKWMQAASKRRPA